MTRPTDDERRQALASVAELHRVVEAAAHVSRMDNDGFLPTPVFHAERSAIAALDSLIREMKHNFQWDNDLRGAA